MFEAVIDCIQYSTVHTVWTFYGTVVESRCNPYEFFYEVEFYFFCVRHSTLLHLPPSDSAVSEDAGIEPRTVATLALTARRSLRSARIV